MHMYQRSRISTLQKEERKRGQESDGGERERKRELRWEEREREEREGFTARN